MSARLPITFVEGHDFATYSKLIGQSIELGGKIFRFQPGNNRNALRDGENSSVITGGDHDAAAADFLDHALDQREVEGWLGVDG